jgi:hypothetical protein
MSKIHVTIDKLVLSGLDPAARKAFLTGLRSELTRTLADPTTRASLTQSRRTPVLRLDRLPIDPGLGGARKLGSHVARGITQGAAKGTVRGPKS